MSAKHYLAFDLGASGGRAVHGALDGGQLTLEEMHRFPNRMIPLLDHLHWDVLHLLEEIKHGLERYAQRYTAPLESLGIDTWGVDFGLIGRDRTLLGLPYAYRDPQTAGMMEAAFERVSREEIFEQTGIQFMPLNSLYQLLALVQARSPLLDVAERLLMMPDLFNFFLTGEQICEFTDATTTQCYNPRTGAWAGSLLERLSIPTHIMPDIVPPGTVVGPLRGDVAEETRVGRVQVVAPACHDTGSAVAAVPAQGENWGYISVGTWALMGVESPTPIINAQSLAYNFTNEGGVGGIFRVLKNIAGLWLIQECRRIWAREGEELSYDDITRIAEQATPFVAFVDPDDEAFLNPSHMPEAIQSFCRRTGQTVPETKGAVARCAIESLALKCRYVLDRLVQLRGAPLSVLHIVGGGTQNTLLCQCIANATGLPVVAGPVEATAIGNILVLAMAGGELNALEDIRKVVRRSFPLIMYEPQEIEAWNETYEQFRAMIDGIDK